MKLIDKIIKILIGYKYKKEPFMVWSWGIDEIHEINILTAEYYQDHYRYGTREEWYKAESEDNMSKHWIDDADHWICPDCGFITPNPNRYEGCKCPKCGFQDAKDRADSEAEDGECK